MPTLDTSFSQWLNAHADALDQGECSAALVVPRLAEAGVLGVGVPANVGGAGGGAYDVVELIASVAERSVTAAFVLWGQRVFIEYLLHTPNAELHDRLLPPLLGGQLAGATGLSNAMKFLSGVEELQVRAESAGDRFRLSGFLPWVTNLRRQGFVLACAVDHGSDQPASIFAVPGDAPGLTRSEDLDLLGLRASDTAAVSFEQVDLGDGFRLHARANEFLQAVRPTFISYQCALALGLARASLRHVREAAGAVRGVLDATRVEQERHLSQIARDLSAGLLQRTFEGKPQELFQIRLRLIEIALASVNLELMARGGRAYLHGDTGFARRWREASFLPIVTPSVVQLRTELLRHSVRECA